MTRLTDGRGWTVEPASVDGVAQFIVRTPNGILANAQLGVAYRNPTTPAELAALGVDLASLR